jgi:hypothetical protein
MRRRNASCKICFHGVRSREINGVYDDDDDDDDLTISNTSKASVF